MKIAVLCANHEDMRRCRDSLEFVPDDRSDGRASDVFRTNGRTEFHFLIPRGRPLEGLEFDDVLMTTHFESLLARGGGRYQELMFKAKARAVWIK